MIHTQVRIHDKFSVEFKIGFFTSENKDKDRNRFKINSWIFLPNGLDINRHTYLKEQFYSDVKSNVRLITPIYALNEILTEGRGPFPRLERAIEKYLSEPSDENAENYTYQLKMLLCIVKSALRNNCYRIDRNKKEKQPIERFAQDLTKIINRFRMLRNEVLQDNRIPDELKEYFLFGDEFLTFITEDNLFNLLKTTKTCCDYNSIKTILQALLENENQNRLQMGYSFFSEKEEGEHNSLMLIKKSLLKKFVESDLYLQRIKKADGALAREFYYSVAAGIAMIFATIISFLATQRFGNFTMALFFALVVSYVFKDRIKEMARYYFSSKLDQKYFDWKWNVSVRNQKIGWIKEAFDFISEKNVPDEIMELRNKSPLVKAENKVYDEQVILYRKRVELFRNDLEKYKEYHLSGINDIIRLNLISFTKKMDNPTIPIHLLDEKNETKIIQGKRVYALYFILECQSEGESYFKKYRLFLNRDGISDVKEIGLSEK